MHRSPSNLSAPPKGRCIPWECMVRLRRQVEAEGPPREVTYLKRLLAERERQAEALMVSFGGHIDMSAVYDCVRLRFEIDAAYGQAALRA